MSATRAARRAQIFPAPFEALAHMNLAINPRHVISQINGNSIVTVGANAGNVYIDDGNNLFTNGTSLGVTGQNVSNSPFTTRPDLLCALKIGVSTAKSVLAAADLVTWNVPIEGMYSKRLQWGGLSGLPLSVGVMLLPNFSGNVYMCAHNPNAATAYYFQKITLVANQEQFAPLLFPPNTTAVWGNGTTNVGLSLSLVLASGTSSQGTPNQWGSTGFCGSDQVNFVASSANTLLVSDMIALPVLDGSLLPTSIFPLERLPMFERDYDDELRKAQRYYETSDIPIYESGYWSGTAANLDAGTMEYKATKRIAPTVTFSSVTLTNCASLTAFKNSSRGFVASVSIAATNDYIATYNWAANSLL